MQFIFVLLLLVLTGPAEAVIGALRVLDAQTHRPIEGALVTAGGSVASTDTAGELTLPTPLRALGVRAPGYLRAQLSDTGDTVNRREVHLQPFRPKALYLSFYGIGDRDLRGAALKLMEQTELNALVIDVKGDQGHIPYHSKVVMATEVGAQKPIIVQDMPTLLASLRERGIYTIARIVAFKDNPLARSHQELAVRNRVGEIWADPEGLAWTDPFRPEVWAYILAVAEEAAKMGFDEVQFDYLRFPDEPGLVFSKPATEANRMAAISGFLTEAARRLAPYNVFVAADVFGYVLWNRTDTGIGQRLEDLAPHLDYISPMLYPSAFQYGIPGYRDPVAAPHEVVDLSLRNAQKRTALPALHFRPWLQSFRDYAFDRRVFGSEEIRAQIRAAEEFGSDGWMLWNPRNIYSAAGLRGKEK
ncbi:MAG: putative glycoside hydrolase [Thiobacillaceae bacterium]